MKCSSGVRSGVWKRETQSEGGVSIGVSPHSPLMGSLPTSQNDCKYLILFTWSLRCLVSAPIVAPSPVAQSAPAPDLRQSQAQPPTVPP